MKEKQMLAWMSNLLEQQRNEAYNRQQAALPFNQRELPFTDADVRRLGGEMDESEEEDEGGVKYLNENDVNDLVNATKFDLE